MRPERPPLAERLKAGMESLLEGTNCRTTYVSGDESATLFYEPEADVLYIMATKEKVARTEQLTPGILLDTDENGRVVGLKLLQASIQLAKVPIARESDRNAA